MHPVGFSMVCVYSDSFETVKAANHLEENIGPDGLFSWK